MEKTGCKIVCGAPTTLAVKGLMMMMMMVVVVVVVVVVFYELHPAPLPTTQTSAGNTGVTK